VCEWLGEREGEREIKKERERGGREIEILKKN